MAQIVDMMINAYVSYLTEKLQTDIDPDDPTLVRVIRGGRLQEDPITDITYVTFHPNDPDIHGWKHTPSNAESSTPYGLRSQIPGLSALPSFEIGGLSMLWWRKLKVELGMFWLNQSYTRDQARQYSHMILGRLEYYIMKVNMDNDAGVLGLVDEFGEQVMQVILSSSKLLESGGPPSDWIWRGDVWIDVLTERNFD